MPAVLAELGRAGEPTSPTAPLQPHFSPKAKRVIFLYMSGGVSHIDTFDPKPRLAADHGKKVGDSFSVGKGKFVVAPQRTFARGGQCGIEVSDLFPNVRECADDLCVIRSLHTDHGNHFEATLQMHTGSFSFARPSIGSWVSYGLGTDNQNLPSFVVLAPHLPYAGGQVWGNDILPGIHQGVRVQPGDEPIPDLRRRLSSPTLQEMELGFLQEFNKKHLAARPADPQLAARIQAYETAFGMQQTAPEAFDLSRETDATLALYGLERGSTRGFAWQCLMARRLAERGVRFIELIDTGASNNWDSHGNMDEHVALARNVDRPIAGLLRDLKSRGMLEDTLVVWTTEFGRTPFSERADAKGREHHQHVFTSWLAGGGVKAGHIHGSSDDYGIGPAENPVHLHDFHATILHLLGLDHEKLTYTLGGRAFRLTNVAGEVVPDLIA